VDPTAAFPSHAPREPCPQPDAEAYGARSRARNADHVHDHVCVCRNSTSQGGPMITTKKIACLVALAACSIVPSIAFSAQCAGTNINNLVSWDQTEIAKGTTHATLRLTSVTVSDDPGASNHLLSGECIGIYTMTPDGKSHGIGTCARVDKDGDVLNEEWVSTNDAGDKGTWKNTGGTGKFAKAANTARWEVIKLQGKLAAVRWIGNCQ
jgi:hypothetical protein